MKPLVNSSRHAGTIRALFMAGCSILLGQVFPTQARAADSLNVKGKWTWVDTTLVDSRWDAPTGPGEVGLRWPGSGGATHMALLRGNADSSWVLHWHFGSSARLWLAKPMRDTTASVAVPIDTQNEMNTFCAGQAVRADGRLMVVGGTVVGTTGETRVPVFDPWIYKNSARGWTVSNTDTVKYGRWYASVTPLGSGKMLATSGFDFLNGMMFGGVKTGGGDSLMNDFRPLNLRRWLRWEDDRPTLANRPAPRHGHSAVFNLGTGRTVLFGGVRKNSAGTQDSLLNEVRQVFVENIDTGQKWTWENLTVNGDQTHGYPPPRHRHTAQIVDNVMIVYGGLGKSTTGQDSVLSDVWRLTLNPNNTHQWKKDDPGAGPNARYGHTAVIDGDEDGGLLPSMVVYGGRREPNSTFASDTVWKLTLDRVDQAKPLQWQAIAWGGPGKREGHVAVMDTIDRHTSPDSHRVVVFGGEKDGAGLTNDVWVLCRPEPGTTWTWHALEVDGTPPPARKRHQAIYDAEWQRLLVFGGDTSLNTAGGEVADIWSVPLDSGNPSWGSHRHDNAPVARQGGAMIFDIRAVSAKIPELFLAAGSAGNDWDPLDGAAKRLDNYPLTFQIKNGNVFYAGNSSLIKNDSSYAEHRHGSVEQREDQRLLRRLGGIDLHRSRGGERAESWRTRPLQADGDDQLHECRYGGLGHGIHDMDS